MIRNFKIKKYFWHVYATKKMAMEQQGSYAWFAYSHQFSKTVVEQMAKGWCERHNCKIICSMPTGSKFTILKEIKRGRPWDVFKILTDDGKVGWIIAPLKNLDLFEPT